MKKRFGLTTQIFIIISVLLLAANITLGVLMMNQSRNVMKTLIGERMLDISNTAAATLDGDVLESITAEDEGTPEYQSVVDALTVFQDNIDLEYIYCIEKVGEKEFAFSIDPTVEDPGEFGEPIKYTDALYTASLGTPAVDDEPYTDSWGRFYSSYSPVFDSEGNVAGIVAVDFSADWYDAQIRNIVITILISSVLSMVIGGVIVLLITSRIRKNIRGLDSELRELSAEVDLLTSEIIKPGENGTAPPKKDKKHSSDDIRALGEQIRSTREALDQYINHLQTRENNMITALAADYRSVFYVNLDDDEGICYRSRYKAENNLTEGETFCFSEVFGRYAEKHVTEEYRNKFLYFISPEHIRQGLETESVITFNYLAIQNYQEVYEKIRIAGVRRPEDKNTLDLHDVGLCITDVDREVRESMARNRALSDALKSAEESNKAKTVFLSNMSHEIRTPMNAIIGLDSLMLSDSEISDRTRDGLEKIDISAKHLLNIINDILDMSRIESGQITLKKEEFFFLGVIEQVNTIVSEQCKEKGLTYNCNLSPEIESYYIGDDVKIKQILINILGNAVKFTHEGGKISLSVEQTARFKGNSTLRFTIEDNGIGMNKDFIPQIFDAFSQEDSSSTNRYGSTGLGMAITKRFMEIMNGKIEVESEKGKGTRFFVTLTLLTSEPNMSDKKKASAQKALVIGVDSKRTRNVIEKAGIITKNVLLGAEGVKIVRLNHERGEDFNIIIIENDLNDMDCIEVAKQIHSIIGSSAAVFLIGNECPEFTGEMKSAGIDGVLKKSLMRSYFINEIRRVVDNKPETDTGAPAKVKLEGKTILLAEDNEINAEIIEAVLNTRGIITDLAVNGKIAVEMFKSKPEGYYSAVLMDMRMPEMDGLETTETIRALDRPDARAVPIIALTANAFDEDVQRSLQAGLNAHLSKPVNPDKLFETLEEYLNA